MGKDAQFFIDCEYTGQEAKLRAMLLRYFSKIGARIKSDQIQFAQIGKKSKAHKLALSVFREREKANSVLREKELLKFAQ